MAADFLAARQRFDARRAGRDRGATLVDELWGVSPGMAAQHGLGRAVTALRLAGICAAYRSIMHKEITKASNFVTAAIFSPVGSQPIVDDGCEKCSVRKMTLGPPALPNGVASRA